MLNSENRKYVLTECPFSTIRSKKLTALTVHAIADKANKIVKNDFNISKVKYL
jgi:hypothetical protein